MENNTLLENVPLDLMYQALETEKGGVQIYTTALRLAINKDLREEWNKYLEQTKNHVQVVSDILTALGLDPDAETPGRKVVRYLGTSLVKTMELASRCADPQAAQIVAAECVTLAETKDHLNWELMGELAKQATAEESALLTPAYKQVEGEEDEHFITQPVGRVNYGSRLWECLRCYLHPRKKGKLKPQSKRPRPKSPEPRMQK